MEIVGVRGLFAGLVLGTLFRRPPRVQQETPRMSFGKASAVERHLVSLAAVVRSRRFSPGRIAQGAGVRHGLRHRVGP